MNISQRLRTVRGQRRQGISPVSIDEVLKVDLPARKPAKTAPKPIPVSVSGNSSNASAGRKNIRRQDRFNQAMRFAQQGYGNFKTLLTIGGVELTDWDNAEAFGRQIGEMARHDVL